MGGIAWRAGKPLFSQGTLQYFVITRHLCEARRYQRAGICLQPDEDDVPLKNIGSGAAARSPLQKIA
jgi:hypothetical protein